MSSNINIVNSSGIALINNGKIFLIKPFMSNNDRWGIPKGRNEFNEDIQKTAIREFHEETGMRVIDSPKFFLKVNTRFKNILKIVEVYKCIGSGAEKFIKSNLITEGERSGNPENVDGKWFSYNEALKIIHPYQIPIIKKLKEEDRHFKTFIGNREATLEAPGAIYNKTISVLLYDTLAAV